MKKLNSTNWKHEIKTDKRDELNCVIGDDKEIDFKPQMKIERWSNECNVSIRLIEDDKETPTIKTEREKIKYIKRNRECHFYQIQNKEHPEGASEFEIVLKKKPKTNKIEFSVVDKDVSYFHQPALTQKEKDEGASRPENVIGSYAIYAKTPKTNYVGKKEYKCGKIGHIFRPQMIDAKGNKVWGNLLIENGILSVEIPQDFLDKAVYPVRHAAGLTFGFTTQGATEKQISSAGSPELGGRFNLSQNGTVTSISAYTKSRGIDGNYKYAIYNDDGSANGTPMGQALRGQTASTALTAAQNTYDLRTVDLVSSVSLNAGNYWIGWQTSDYPLMAGDTLANSGWRGGAGTWPTLPNPYAIGGLYINIKLSIYATYTAGGSVNTINSLSLLGIT